MRLAYSSLSESDDSKKLTVRWTQKKSIGALQDELIDKDFWLNVETDANFDKPKSNNTGIIFVENLGSFYPVATNMPDVSLDSREALIAIGGLLSSNVSSVDGPKNIFENCVDQSAFDEQWNMIYEDVTSGEVKRESCSFCDELYQKTKDQTLLKNSFLK